MKKLLLILFSISNFVFAQIVFDPVYNLSNTMSATSDYHSVYTENNNYYVVWGDNGEIMFKHSSYFGMSWGANKTISNTPNICGWPVIVSNGAHLYTAYHHLANNYEIVFQRSTDQGLTWSAMDVLSNTSSEGITPQIAASVNNVFVVWEQKLNNIADIFFVKSTDFGVTWSVPQNLSNTPALYSRWIQLLADGSTLYCAWLESPSYPLNDIYFSKSTDNGNTWTTPVNITNDDRAQNRIYLTLNFNGTIYIASDDIITFNHDEIFLLQSTDGGSNWSPPLNITNNAGNSNTPCLMTFGDNIYFTWSDNSHTGPAYNNSDIFFKWSSDGGTTWNDSTNISDNPETSSRPRICWGIDGPIPAPWIDFTLIWYDYSTGNAEILARHGVHPFVPVELVSFNAEVEKQDVILSWTTASETNNKGFEVEYSIKNSKLKIKNFETVGFVTGNGTSTELNHYSFKDENLSAGKYVYRLKQIDFDGSFEYSNEIEVDVNVVNEFVLYQNYPNPFNPVTMIRYSIAGNKNPSGTEETGNVSLKVFDVLGNEVAVLVNETQAPGNYEVEFNAAGLSSGVYIYKLSAGYFNSARKLILLK